VGLSDVENAPTRSPTSPQYSPTEGAFSPMETTEKEEEE
jgi:hypothetical protein